MIIVPVDFSTTSMNAARYACQWAAQLGQDKLHLYHSYIADDGMAEIGPEGVEAKSRQALQELKAQLQQLPGCPEISMETNQEPVLAYLNQTMQKRKGYHIVMGLSGKGKLAQKVIGSTTIKVAQEARCPVVIVPPACTFQPVKTVVLALQLQSGMLEQTPSGAINDMILASGAKLMVLNVNNDSTQTVTREVNAGQHAAHMMFDGIGASFHFEEGTNVPKEVVAFAAANQAQMIVAILQQHGFWHTLFKGSTTEALAFHSNIPIFALSSL